LATKIIEFFGYSATDLSANARDARARQWCPFIDSPCQKRLSDQSVSGACTLKPTKSGPVICCPVRLYADNYRILESVAKHAFDCEPQLIEGSRVLAESPLPGKERVAVFGKRWGGELRLPNRTRGGGYFVDWVLARIDLDGQLKDFVAVEVQSIDTTGNYQEERRAHLAEQHFAGSSTAGFNWENVNKRILPQIIYKGHALRREPACKGGLFFVCPHPVYNKIRERLGGNLMEYQLQPGSLSLMWYDIGPEVPPGHIRELELKGSFTTTVDQVALAFTAPTNLPDSRAYENAIRSAL